MFPSVSFKTSCAEDRWCGHLPKSQLAQLNLIFHPWCWLLFLALWTTNPNCGCSENLHTWNRHCAGCDVVSRAATNCWPTINYVWCNLYIFSGQNPFFWGDQPPVSSFDRWFQCCLATPRATTPMPYFGRPGRSNLTHAELTAISNGQCVCPMSKPKLGRKSVFKIITVWSKR